MKNVAAAGGVLLCALRKRTHSGKGVPNVMLRKPGLREQPDHGAQQIFDFIDRRLYFGRIRVVLDLGCAHQDLLVPGKHPQWAAVEALAIERSAGRSGEVRQDDVGPAYAMEHRFWRLDGGTLAEPVCPGAGGV